MINIDVLLKAAEFIDAQESTSPSSSLSNSNQQLASSSSNNDSSLSPKSSSSASSLFNSPNSFNHLSINTNNDDVYSSPHRIYHKKFNNKRTALTPIMHIAAEKSNEISNTSTSFQSLSSSLPTHMIKPTCSSLTDQNNNKRQMPNSNSNSNSNVSRLDEIKRDKAIHNTLEKNRRAHLKECFENLQNELPQYKDKKCTNLSILNYTLKYVEQSRKKDKENELERARLKKKQLYLKHCLKKILFDIRNEFKNLDYMTLVQQLNLNLNSDDIADLEDPNFKFSSNSEDFDANVDESVYDLLDNHNSNSVESESTSTASEATDYILKSNRKRSSNSLSTIIDLKSFHTPTPKQTQSQSLQLQLKLQLQKSGKKLANSQRHRHYSVDESSIASRQRQRRKTSSVSIKNALNVDDEPDYDDYDDFSIDETNTTADLDLDSNNDEYDDESRDLVINEDDDQVEDTGTAKKPVVVKSCFQKIINLEQLIQITAQQEQQGIVNLNGADNRMVASKSKTILNIPSKSSILSTKRLSASPLSTISSLSQHRPFTVNQLLSSSSTSTAQTANTISSRSNDN